MSFLTGDQIKELRKVFGEDWEAVLSVIKKNLATIESAAKSADLAIGYKAADDIAGLLQRALDRLIDKEPEVYKLVASVAEALASTPAKPEDKVTPSAAMSKKARRGHLLERLAEGTPLGARQQATVKRVHYKADLETGQAHLVEVETVGVKSASDQHPLLQRLGAGTPGMGLTTDEYYDRVDAIERGDKAVSRPSPLLRRDSPLAITTEELEAARERKMAEAEAVKAIEDAAQPRQRYKFVTCPICGYSHSIKSGGLEGTSRYCVEHGDIMQPTTSAGDVSQARQSAPVQLPGGGGKLTTTGY